MFKLQAKSSLDGYRRKYDGLSLKEVSFHELIALSQAEGEEKAFRGVFKKQFSKTPPNPLELKPIEGGYAFWSGQGQYMLLLDGENVEVDREVSRAFKGVGYATLQTDGWAQLALSGARVYDVFERFIPLDMRSFEVGQATRTHAHHMAVIVLRIAEDDYRLLTPRSSCEAFVKSLEHVIEHVVLSEKL